MTTMTLTPARRATLPVGLALGCVAGTALLAAGIWNALIQEHVTVPAAPSGIGPQVPPLQAMHTYYTWYAGTVGQQRADTIVAMIGVSGLVLLADAVRRRAGADLLTRAACTAIGTGSIVWLIGALIGIGGHRAVGLMATHGNPVAGVNSIAFTVDVTADAFSAAAFILLGLAMVALGIAPFRAGSPRWTTLSTITGFVSLVVAIGYLQGIDSVTTYVLGALAAALLPAWLVWTGHLLDSVDS
jgi:hypothetical protein